MDHPRFDVTFWGVRGTIPTASAHTLGFGGNTSCVSMQCGNRTLIFDAGTGLYPLGETLEPVAEMDLFLSHTHIDHILGFPFFSPLYREDKTVRVYAGHLQPDGLTLRGALSQLMSPPLFPLTLDFLKAKLSYHDFSAGESPACPHLTADGIRITTLALHHPDRATAYRVDYAGAAACYVTDVEHSDSELDAALINLIQGADLFIYDSTFDDRDFHRFKGWGHSTWQQAVRLADAAGVKQLALFHHDPARSDDELHQREAELAAVRPGCFAAKEGMRVQLLAATAHQLDDMEETHRLMQGVGC